MTRSRDNAQTQSGVEAEACLRQKPVAFGVAHGLASVDAFGLKQF